MHDYTPVFSHFLIGVMFAHERRLSHSLFIQLMEHGKTHLYTLFQYAFCCNQEDEVAWINSLMPVSDGKVHVVNIRYVLCYIQLTF